MKTAFAFLAIVTVCCCKKKTENYRDKLFTRWEIRASYGGWVSETFPPGNGQIIEYKSDYTFVRYRKDTIIQSGTYSLEATSKKDEFKITYENGWFSDIKLKRDTLLILPRCCDIPGATYVRVP